jgi:hypothetical protein
MTTAYISDEAAGSENSPALSKPVIIRQRKQRKFYLLTRIPANRGAGWRLVNAEKMAKNDQPGLLSVSNRFEREFPDYAEPPRFHVSKRFGRKLHDFEKNGAFWMVSNRAKEVLIRISPKDFKFLAVETIVDEGDEPLVLWLCEVVTILDAVDEARSHVSVAQSGDGFRSHLISGISQLEFNETIVGEHHAFRLLTSPGTIVMDDFFRENIKREGLKGLSFRDAAKSIT